MKYEKKDIHEGMKLKCTSTDRKNGWIVGKTYKIKKRNDGSIYITDETGYNWSEKAILDFLSKNDMFNTKLEIVKEENKMQDFKVGHLVEVISNKSKAVNEAGVPYKKGDHAIITNVYSTTVRLGNNPYANLIKKTEIKKVETKPEITEYEEELVLRLAEAINRKDNYLTELENLKYKLNEMEYNYEDVSKEIKEISKKLLTK